MKQKAILLVSLLIVSSFLLSQDLSRSFKNWYITGVNVRINKKITTKISRLQSFDVKDYQTGFHQTNLGIAKRFSRRWEIGGAYAWSAIVRKGENQTYSRISLYATHRTKWGNFQLKNTAQLEKYFPVQQKFGGRIVLTNKWSYSTKKWPLQLSPYLKNQLYYYQGGSEITYWLDEADIDRDVEEGEEIEESIEQAPNGWHRYRITVGARSKLNKQLALSLFYTKQIEFNTGLAPYRELNVYNRSKTRRKRPFNNYALVGMSLIFTLKTY